MLARRTSGQAVSATVALRMSIETDVVCVAGASATDITTSGRP